MSAPSSRRTKRPTFLPSEHDELPINVSFMVRLHPAPVQDAMQTVAQTLTGHLDTISALDFTEPYGTLISASADESLRMWDLSTGEETGFLRGHNGALSSVSLIDTAVRLHTGMVKCLQVEGSLCISGGADGTVRLWDLERAEEDAAMPIPPTPGLSGLAALKEEVDEDDGLMTGDKGDSACMRVLTGHASAVTACYFEENCLVRSRPLLFVKRAEYLNTGHGRFGQDATTMGSHDRAMRHDDGHPLGDIESSRSILHRFTSRLSSSHDRLRIRLLRST